MIFSGKRRRKAGCISFSPSIQGRRDTFTFTVSHEIRAVARLSALLAQECGIHPTAAKRIGTAAALHDIGKIQIPADILNKPEPLDKREFEIIKTHTVLGADMLSSIQGEVGIVARKVCRYHHEHYDGGGYWGKYTDELPLYVSITAISDVFVALVSERPYKSAWPPQEALDYIQSKAGTQFNPVLAQSFLSLIRNDSRVPAIFMKGTM